MSRGLLMLALAGALCVALPADAAKQARKSESRAATRGTPFSHNVDAMQWADDFAKAQGLPRRWVRHAIGQARDLPAVVKLMQPPPSGTPKNWAAYRARFIEAGRIDAGVKFWQANQPALERAEREYGVPPEMIVGIIGVETYYGRHTGSFRVIDALATLAFDFPASHPRAAERSAYFRRELGQFLLTQSRAGEDPLAPQGSYAGAVGLPQFMPSSIAQWAVDFDGDGRIDLLRSPTDAIGSVASYFKAFGWQPGMPTHFPVSFAASGLDKEGLLAPDILPTFSVPAFTAKGAVLDEAGAGHTGQLALVELQNGESEPSYVAGTANFYTITRYNWSSYYAMAVIELGREVRAALNR